MTNSKSVVEAPPTVKYADLPTGHFFRIAKRPDLGRFFKCQPWVSTTEDLEKIVQFKPEVDVFIDEKTEVSHD